MHINLIAILGTAAILVVWHPIQAQEGVTKVRVDTSKRPKFVNEPGWTWKVDPVPFRLGKGGFSSSGAKGNVIADTVVDADNGSYRFSYVEVGPGEPEPDENPMPFRFVVFDKEGHRYPVKGNFHGGGSGNHGNGYHVRHGVFTVDPKTLDRADAAYLGFEQKTPIQIK